MIRDESVLLAACADGAGSASLSEIGAEIAVHQVIAFATAELAAGLDISELTREHLLAWYRGVRTDIEAAAAARSVPVRELACTLLVAVVGQERAAFAQVGDGAIVVRSAEQYVVVFWPQSGEYANSTNFVTGPEFEASLEFATMDAPNALALFTDGLQNLILNNAQRAAHQQFFRAMFDQLARAEAPEELIAPLRAFLDSPAVNERTDDDKTLILAWRSHGADNAS